ncbi:MAG: hypothetical protein AB1489_24900 [Acidobacteriota bacterium]
MSSESSPLSRICFRCGYQCEVGALCYRVSIEIVADFDGYIDADALLAEPAPAAQAIAAADRRSAESLTHDIYQQLQVFLCKSCKDRVLATFQQTCETTH